MSSTSAPRVAVASSPQPRSFRKKPVVIEAMQWTPGDLESVGVMWAWLGLEHGQEFSHGGGLGSKATFLISTLEGTMEAQPGDWVIRGIKGEFYPCKPDIFDATYEPADGL